MLTKKELDAAIYRDYEKTVRELVENCDLLLKGNRMLVENRLSEEEYQVLQEGAWESIKYGLAKLGRYKVGGKGPFSGGRGKIDQEAGAKIQKILDKKGNEVIKKLDDAIKKENPEFPNNKEGEKFLGTVVSIAEIYDSIVASTKKNPKEEGYLPIDAANSIIADLAEYVQKFLDVDLAAAYTVMDSEEDTGNQDLITDSVGDINEDEAADLRAKLQAKGGDKKYDTKRMGKEGLKSNRLPMTLAGVGASLGAFSWLVNTEWFKSLFTTIETKKDVVFIKETIQTKSEIFGQIEPGQGMTQLMNEMNNLGLDPSSSPEEFLGGVKQLGGGDLQAGINALAEKGGIFRDPDAAREVLNEIAKNPHGHGDNLGEIFQDKWAGTGKSMGDALVTVPGGTLKGLIVKTLIKMVPKIITTTVVKTSAAYLALKGLAGILGPIGVGLVAAGALVKIMRVKGQKQSRAKTLNDLLQSLQPIKAEGDVLPPVLPNPKPNPVGGGGKGKNVCNAKNVNELNKLLNKIKSDSKNFSVFKNYMKDDEFRDIFFSAIADVNQSIKINKQPLVKTLAALRSQGLIEAPTGRQRNYLKFKLDFQNFMNDVFKLFIQLSKNCKNNETYNVIKEFYKQLYIIATQGKNAGVKSKVKFDPTVGSNNPCEKLKVGMEVVYKSNSGDESVHVVTKLLGGGNVQIRKKEGEKRPTFGIECNKVKPLNESFYFDQNLLNEDANKELRDKLFKKLAGNFSNFLNALNKLKPIEKGKEGKPSEEEIAKRKEAKKGKGGEKGTEGDFEGSAPRTKPPQLAHYDRGDKFLYEEITRIKKLMK